MQLSNIKSDLVSGHLDVHEVRVGMLHQSLQLVSPSLCPHIWLQQVHSELQGRVRLGTVIYCIYLRASPQDVGRWYE